jgi:hypothetical protein
MEKNLSTLLIDNTQEVLIDNTQEVLIDNTQEVLIDNTKSILKEPIDNYLKYLQSVRIDKIYDSYNDNSKIYKLYKININKTYYKDTLNEIIYTIDYMTNFRTNDDIPLGHLDTKVGKIPIPVIWNCNRQISKKYGVPYRENIDIYIDGYIVNNKIRELLYKQNDLIFNL